MPKTIEEPKEEKPKEEEPKEEKPLKLFETMVKAHNKATEAHWNFYDKIKMTKLFTPYQRNTSKTYSMFKKIWKGKDGYGTGISKKTWSPTDKLTVEATKFVGEVQDEYNALIASMRIARDAREKFINHYIKKYPDKVRGSKDERPYGVRIAAKVETIINGGWWKKIVKEKEGWTNEWWGRLQHKKPDIPDKDNFLYMNQIPGIRGFIEDENKMKKATMETFWKMQSIPLTSRSGSFKSPGNRKSGSEGIQETWIENDNVKEFFNRYIEGNQFFSYSFGGRTRKRRRKSRKSKRKRRRTKKKSKRRRKRTKKKRRRRRRR